MGDLLGYARVSTTDQNASPQVDALEAAGCSRLFVDHASGALDERVELARLFDHVRPDDTVVVWRLDRLGRSLRHLIDTVNSLAALGAVLNALHQPDDLTDAIEDLRSNRTEIAEAMATVTELMRSPSDPFHDRLIAAYPQIRRFLPDLLAALDLDATPASAPVVEAVDALDEWLNTLPRTTNRPDSEVPTEIVPTSWQRYVHPESGRVNRAAYACCVLDQLRSGLRRRDIYLPDSRRWGDPRAELLPEPAWERQRTEACDSLALTTNPKTAARELIDSVDTAWRQAADRYEANDEFRVEERDGADRVVVTPLDAIEELTSLTELRGLVTELMPEVEISDIPLEVHDWTGHLDDYTHISGASTRTTDLHRSVAALLIADACNVGLTPVVDDNDPALNRERLNWVAQNYVRSATHAAASTRLFNHHAALPLSRAWRGGDMASADGMRLVIPVSTDTAGASEIVFALAWTLGYRYAPRLADRGDHRLWHANPSADYGPLAGLARNRASTPRGSKRSGTTTSTVAAKDFARSDWRGEIGALAASDGTATEKQDAVDSLSREYLMDENAASEQLDYLIGEFESGVYLTGLGDENYALQNIFIARVLELNQPSPIRDFAFDFYQNTKYVYRGVDAPDSDAVKANEDQMLRAITDGNLGG